LLGEVPFIDGRLLLGLRKKKVSKISKQAAEITEQICSSKKGLQF
jgi:hypothetical protein